MVPRRATPRKRAEGSAATATALVLPDEYDSLDRVFPGHSELAARMRALDWSQTGLRHLGPPASWPQNLRIALGICLTSRFPMHVWWGPSLTLFYNDAYVSFLGPIKHPAMLGRSGREAWAEIWNTIGPMIDAVMRTGIASWSEDILMYIDRELPQEEVYATFSFSPVLGEGGTVDGLFCACTESTQKIVGKRRLETLRLLGVRAGEAQSVAAACQTSAEVLDKNPEDIPFAAIYVCDMDDGVRRATLSACAGLPADHALPASVAADSDDPSPGPLQAALRTGREQEVPDLCGLGVCLLGGPWPEPASRALVIPIHARAHEGLSGLLLVGVGPRRVLDEQYRTFFRLAAGHIGTAIDDARAYEAERRRAESLAELDRARTTFFSNVSHEFRTPLTLMLGPLEDLLAALPPGPPGAGAGAQTRPLLETVYRNGLRLLRLVNTLLDFSRVESGRMQASFEATDLPAMTAELAGVFRSAAERAGLRYTVRCAPLPGPVHVDREMWEKIVLNLLSNAFKFTFSGEIEVTLGRAPASGAPGPNGAGRVELSVRDTGVGVAPDELPRLFERFHRVEGVRARTHEGSGIGLALVQELVHMHGGEIRAQSELGKGTTFTVSIPCGTAHLQGEPIGAGRTPSSPATEGSTCAGEALRWLAGEPASSICEPAISSAAGPEASDGADEIAGARVLIVDDNADMREYLGRLLSPRFSVQGAADGEEALLLLRQERFDLVLTDVMLPGLDGFGLLRALRADAALQAIPVIVLTARAEEESRIEGLQSGADDYLVKPFSAREVLARVEAHLKLAARRQAVEQNRAKDQFIAMLGHELRNPLAPIITSLQLLRLRGTWSPEHAVIERQAGHLMRLVDDLLDISRITRGQIALRRQRMELGSAVALGVELAGPLLEQQRDRLELAVPATGLTVEGDAERLAQVVSNLLTNAAKYSDPGTRIVVSAGRAGTIVRLRVRDQGIGIPAGMLGRVFDVFAQQPQALDRARGGLGLGLAIVRSLVELHGGTVRAQSEGPGKGSEFIVDLPAALPLGEAERAQSPRAAVATPAERRRLLLVDDNRDLAETLAQLLEELGFEVLIARDGRAALDAAHRFQPEVCLLDIGLPEMDGYELARRLRADRELPRDLRLVALTGYGQDVDRQRSQEAGFDEHLVKPVNLDLLRAAIAG